MYSGGCASFEFLIVLIKFILSVLLLTSHTVIRCHDTKVSFASDFLYNTIIGVSLVPLVFSMLLS